MSRFALVVLPVVLVFAGCPSAQAEDVDREAMGQVPNLLGHTLANANHYLQRRGLKLGRTTVITAERIHGIARATGWPAKDRYPTASAYARAWKPGRVYLQRPPAGTTLDLGSEVDVLYVGKRDGDLPPPFAKHAPVPIPERDESPAPPAPAPEMPRPDAPPPVDVPEGDPAPTSAPDADPTPEGTPRPQAPAASDRPSDPPPATAGDVAPGTARPPAPDETQPPEGTGEDAPHKWEFPEGLPGVDGSLEAPQVAPAPRRDRIPQLVGLDVNDAEDLARRSDMTLYVERVPGHPIGRVLRQFPAPGPGRPVGDVIKVYITAGGDYPTDVTPAAPAVYVPDVEMPDLLDRTQAQAQRILEALGLSVEVKVSEHGLPGVVKDQKPAMGARVRKGSVVQVFVGPGEPDLDPTRGLGEPVRGLDPSGSGGQDLPRPIAPAEGTPMPRDAAVPLAFSWRKVPEATAYIVEIEEQKADGAWTAAERRTVRTTTLTLELLRLDTTTPRALRWRVRARMGATQGVPSRWIRLPAER